MTTKIILDPGHGGYDPGATGNGLKEKDLTLDIADRLYDLLRDYNVDIMQTRLSDDYLSLVDRTDMANSWGADYFLSIHINAGGGTGYEDYVFPGVGQKTLLYQDYVHEMVYSHAYSEFPDRGQKTANFHVLRESKMPALLTENLFIDNLEDANFLSKPENRQKIARSHLLGILDTLDIEQKKNPGGELYHVQVGAYADKGNAEAMAQRLQDEGFNTYITKY